MLVCDGHFRQFNPAFVELMGGTASQLLGLGVSVLFGGPGHSDLFTARVTPSLASGQALRETATLFRLDGSRFEARLAGRSLKMDDFGTASIWVIEDVSDQRRAELAIQQTKERLELAQEAGKIGVFDRSHYEDVLIGRVRHLADDAEIERRYGAINEFEAELVATGTRVVKVMLHISPDEQKARLMERLDRPDKHWKYNPGDVDERLVWPQYMQAYQTVFDRTSTAVAPWHVIPANAKWYARLAVQELLLAALEDIDPEWPRADFDVESEKKRLAAS